MDEEPGRLQFIGLHRVGHNWDDLACMHACSGWEFAVAPFYTSEGKADNTSCFTQANLPGKTNSPWLPLFCGTWLFSARKGTDDMLRILNAKGPYMSGIDNLRSDLQTECYNLIFSPSIQFLQDKYKFSWMLFLNHPGHLNFILTFLR